MDRIRIPSDAWVLVCDGAKALVMRNVGDADTVSLELVDVAVQKLGPTRDLGSDRPGRVYQSHSSARSATEETDRHDVGETEFLHTTADTLDTLVAEHGVKSLVVVAPPKVLGILRKRFTPALQAIMTAEVSKDLVHLSTTEIERHLAG